MTPNRFPFASSASVFNRGCAPVAFLQELVTWARDADDSLFAPNNRFDIYSKVTDDLGQFTDITHQKAVMLEVLRPISTLPVIRIYGNPSFNIYASHVLRVQCIRAEAGSYRAPWVSV